MTDTYMNPAEKMARLYCTPPHIVKALLKREFLPGSIWEPAAGRGDIVKVLRECGFREVFASDITDWGFRPCEITDFLRSSRSCDCLITNPPFDRKAAFLEHAKRLARYKIALLLPLESEYTVGFVKRHQADTEFRWKALYAFPQRVRWTNVEDTWAKFNVGWFVFERGYVGEVIREPILFCRNKTK
jgi:hypothetical protein